MQHKPELCTGLINYRAPIQTSCSYFKSRILFLALLVWVTYARTGWWFWRVQEGPSSWWTRFRFSIMTVIIKQNMLATISKQSWYLTWSLSFSMCVVCLLLFFWSFSCSYFRWSTLEMWQIAIAYKVVANIYMATGQSSKLCTVTFFLDKSSIF